MVISIIQSSYDRIIIKKKNRLNDIIHLEVILLYANSLSTRTVYAIHPIYEKEFVLLS